MSHVSPSQKVRLLQSFSVFRTVTDEIEDYEEDSKAENAEGWFFGSQADEVEGGGEEASSGGTIRQRK